MCFRTSSSVCMSLKSGHSFAKWACRKCANKRLMHRGKLQSYSINSSAVVSSGCRRLDRLSTAGSAR
jgi:hypothetical protein